MLGIGLKATVTTADQPLFDDSYWSYHIFRFTRSAWMGLGGDDVAGGKY